MMIDNDDWHYNNKSVSDMQGLTFGLFGSIYEIRRNFSYFDLKKIQTET